MDCCRKIEVNIKKRLQWEINYHSFYNGEAIILPKVHILKNQINFKNKISDNIIFWAFVESYFYRYNGSNIKSSTIFITAEIV